MKNSAMETRAKLDKDIFMYFAQVITFGFADNGIGMSFFKANQIKNVAD
ncbi:RAxF-45 family protein [Rummeliibacillus sp. NPDC094406]